MSLTRLIDFSLLRKRHFIGNPALFDSANFEKHFAHLT
jgi:hypothetical protein